MEEELNALPKDVPMSSGKFDELYDDGILSFPLNTFRKYLGPIKIICKLFGLKYDIKYNLMNRPKHRSQLYKRIKLSDEDILNRLIFLYENFGPFNKSNIDNVFYPMGMICGTYRIRKLGSLDDIAEMIGIEFLPQGNFGCNEKYILNVDEIKHKIIIKRDFSIKYDLNKKPYIVDGYCEETNCVIEVHENNSHKSRTDRLHDRKRQHNIEETGFNYRVIYQRKFFQTHDKPYKFKPGEYVNYQ